MMKRLRIANMVIIIAFFAFEAKGAPIDPELPESTRHLSKFGYLPKQESGSQENASEETISRAISEYQSFMGLNVTGEMNPETTHLMTLPRCGVRDKVETRNVDRIKRYALLGTRWAEKDLTYKISRYSNKLQRPEIDREIARAFAVWSNYTDLKFSPKTGKVDIEIRFEHGNHGDAHPFDESASSSIAHAFPPAHGGEIHFNEDVDWTVDGNRGVNFFQIAVHVIGHSLGLHHSPVKTSVMNPIVSAYDPNFKLDEDDVAGVQALYGRKVEAAPQICEDPRVDAMFTSNDGHTYAFKGDYYWKLKADETAAEHPRLISEKWSGLPGNIDAAFTYKTWTYFFKGSKYWMYGSVRMDGEPFSGHISQGFPGVPDKIDTATVWTKDGELYFFKGDKFWRFGHAKRAYPEPISSWKGLPSNLDAAVVYKGKTFFFKGDGHYRFNDDTLSVDQVDPAFPRLNGGWFDCPFTEE